MGVTTCIFKSLLPAFVLLHASWAASRTQNCEEDDCFWLRPGMTPKSAPKIKCHPREDRLYIYCYKGIELFSPEAVFKLWSSVHAQIHSSTENFKLLHGNSSAQVIQEKYRMDSRWLVWPWHEDSATLSPFGESCFGVVFTISRAEYYIHTTIRAVQWQFPVCFFIGFILFFSAGELSRNPIFFYGSGVTIGVMASILVIVFLLSRLMPNKTVSYTILIAGWSLCSYFLKWMLEHYRGTLLEYKEYVAAYIVTAALLSFTICYYFGPPTEPRRQNLVKWMVQLIALLLLYWSTQVKEASAAVIIIVLSLYMLPPSITNKFQNIWIKMFPPQIKLLTEAEYRKQAVEFTTSELAALRHRCQNSEFDAWRTIQRQKNPLRLAKFVRGDDDHVTQGEMEAYEAYELEDFESLLQSGRDDADDVGD